MQSFSSTWMPVRTVCGSVAALTLLQACPSDEPLRKADAAALRGNECLQLTGRLPTKTDKVDLLLSIDNSSSMAASQAALREQLPKLIRALTSGERFDGDPDPDPAITDLHVGVISSDMGIPGIQYNGCDANGGDDGRLHNACNGTDPKFLSFDPDAADHFAQDVSCTADLGSHGCFMQQPLDAPLKALMPRTINDVFGQRTIDPYTFISTSERGTRGQGDYPESEGGNLGFLRNDAAEGESLIAVVVVTDKEDCSVKQTQELKPNEQLPDDSELRQQDYGLRCFLNKPMLYDVRRFVEGLRLLRHGREDQVVFAAIAGVPEDLVSPETSERTELRTQAAHDRFYDGILQDDRMQEVIDPRTNPGSGNGTLTPSCERDTQQGVSRAYPPRRIVELAKYFGRHSTVQSLCQDDFSQPVDAIAQLIQSHMREPCLESSYARKPDGNIGCEVFWRLPQQAEPGSNAPTKCQELAFLSPTDGQGAAAGSGESCKVEQLPVHDTSAGAVPEGEGWYYDDYSEATLRECDSDQAQRIRFTDAAKPPKGVIATFSCETPLAKVQRTVRVQPSIPAGTQASEPVDVPAIGIGSPCDLGRGDIAAWPGEDAACLTQHEDGRNDNTLICHPDWKVCVQSCITDHDCLDGWKCEKPKTGRALCVYPQCGN